MCLNARLRGLQFLQLGHGAGGAGSGEVEGSREKDPTSERKGHAVWEEGFVSSFQADAAFETWIL